MLMVSITAFLYSLRTGINKIVSEKKGLIYVMYHVNGNPVDYDEVKIHFASGSVNGYFDVAKHTREQWGYFTKRSVDGYFDVVGIMLISLFLSAN